jgi:hypothetical protein
MCPDFDMETSGSANVAEFELALLRGCRWCQMVADGRPLVAEPVPWPTVPYRQRTAFALTYLLSLPSRVAWLFRRRERDEE